MRSWSFAKGHGTRNDFVVVTDRHGMLQPTADDVRHLCDRRAGVGGDGFLRAIKASSMPDWGGDPDVWFMDSRNADGSPGIPGGNGLRVFVRYLHDAGLLDGDDVQIATRLGLREARVLPDGRIATSTGPVRREPGALAVTAGPHRFTADAVTVDLMHAVARSEVPLAELDFGWVNVLDPAGQPAACDNVCFWSEVEPGRLALRHWQRNIGQSVSSGTGAVATAAAYLAAQGSGEGRVVVDVAGGWLEVELAAEGAAMLYGPAVITARGEVSLPDPR